MFDIYSWSTYFDLISTWKWPILFLFQQKLPQAVLVLVDKDFNEVITQINIYGGVFSVGTSK